MVGIQYNVDAEEKGSSSSYLIIGSVGYHMVEKDLDPDGLVWYKVIYSCKVVMNSSLIFF